MLKDRLSRLVPVVERAFKESQERIARKKAEQELEETRSRLDSVVSSLADVVWSMSASPYRLVYINPAAETVYQRLISDFQKNPGLWLEVIHPADRKQVEKLRESALGGRRSIRNTASSGRAAKCAGFTTAASRCAMLMAGWSG